MKQKKKYENPVIEMLGCPLEVAVLSSSPSEVPPELGADVDPYGNGFGPDPFEDITFD